MTDLRVLTLNTWCPPYGRHRDIRAAAIATKLREISPDVVCLQEMFTSVPRQMIMQALQNIYRYQHYFPSGLLGSGLLTLSKFPIVYTDFHRFTLGGKPEKLTHGDYYAGKGIGLTTLQISPGKRINVFNTHTHAQYQPQNDNEYAFFTNSNLLEVTEFISQHSNHPIILCGDLNTRPDQLGCQMLTQQTTLKDIYSALLPNDKGITFSKLNPYVKETDQRLDYIFASQQVRPQTIEITFTESLGATSALAYSDHYALLATVQVQSYYAEPSVLIDDTTITLDLAKEAQRELTFIDGQEKQHIQQAFLTIFSLLDIHQTVSKISRFIPLPVRAIQRFIKLITVLIALYHLLNITLNLYRRRLVVAKYLNTLTSKLTTLD